MKARTDFSSIVNFAHDQLAKLGTLEEWLAIARRTDADIQKYHRDVKYLEEIIAGPLSSVRTFSFGTVRDDDDDDDDDDGWIEFESLNRPSGKRGIKKAASKSKGRRNAA